MQKGETSEGSRQSVDPTTLIGRRAVLVPSPFGESGVAVLLDDGRWFLLAKVIAEKEAELARVAPPVAAQQRRRGSKAAYQEKAAQAVALDRQGIPGSEIGRRLGVSQSAVSRWLRGTSKQARRAERADGTSTLSLAAKRLQGLAMTAKGNGIRETARELRVAPSTVSRWVQAERTTG